jgi:hypothetical protein
MKRLATVRRILKSAVCLMFAAIFAMQVALPVGATSLLDLLPQGVDYYIPGDVCTGGAAPVTGGAIDTTAAQADNMRTVIGVAKTMGITQKGALIAFMTALQESNFNNWANDGNQQGGPAIAQFSSSNPNSAGFPPGGGDHDSVGIFQQRPSSGWSTLGTNITKDTVWQIMGSTKSVVAVAYSAQAFFGSPPNAEFPPGVANPGALKKGLLNKVPNYNDASVSPGVAAQTVQVSAFPDAYAKHQAKAQSLIDQYWNSSAAVPLVVSITAATAPTPGEGNCATEGVTGHSDAVNKILTTVKLYAWPTYCNDKKPCIDRSLPTDKKQEYEAAVRKGGYNGDTCFGGGVDCGAFITHVMRDSGVDPDYNKNNGPTSEQWNYLRNSPKYREVPASEPLSPGDIGIRDGHTLMYIGKVPGLQGDFASASQCDRAPMAGGESRDGFSWYRLK